jgi:hypothetical protein
MFGKRKTRALPENPKYLDAVHIAIEKVQEVGGPENLPPALRTVIYIHSAQGTIDNGGLQYFFEADFPNTPPYARFIEAYHVIGAEKEAELLAKAVALFPFANPHKFVDRRNEFLDSFKDEEGDTVKSPFDPLTKKLCGNKNVWACLEKFVTEHADSFRKSA